MTTPQITRYDVRYRTVARYAASGEEIAPPGEWVIIEGIKGTSATIEGLTSGTTYEVQIRAVNETGPREWSDPRTATVL